MNFLGNLDHSDVVFGITTFAVGAVWLIAGGIVALWRRR